MNFMDFNSTELLHHDTFKTVSLISLCILLKRDTFYAPEIDIFQSICNWYKNNQDADVKVCGDCWLISDVIFIIFSSIFSMIGSTFNSTLDRIEHE